MPRATKLPPAVTGIGTSAPSLITPLLFVLYGAGLEAADISKFVGIVAAPAALYALDVFIDASWWLGLENSA